MGGRRLGFWVAVGGVSILASFLLELVADKTNNVGLNKLVAYTHRGTS